MLRYDVYTRVMRTGILLLVLALGAADPLIVTAPQAAEDSVPRSTEPPTPRRTALIIGNATYEKAPLRNPVNDATDIAATLRQLGFEVTALHNAGRREMEEAIEVFSQELRQGGVGLFYYAGHGVQINGENYLIPVGYRINREQDVKFEAVPVGRILGGMEDAGNDVNIVILDACRDNPFARSVRSTQQGLAVVQAARGSLIAYATSPGAVAVDGAGRNSFYTQLLLDAMMTPGLSVEQVFKQVRTGVLKATSNMQTPWESSSLIGDFYFVPRGTASSSVAEETTRPQVQDAPPVVVSTRTTSTGPDPEVVMWSLIEQSSNPEDIQEFLRVYPDGRLAPAAHLKLRQLLRQQPKNTEVAVREVPREETKVDAGVVSSKAPEVAARISPPEGTKMAVEASPLKESVAAVEASPSKEPAVAVGAPPPEEMKVAAKVSPPTQPDSNREEIFRELLNFGALDQAKLQMAICSAANTVRARHGLRALTTHPLLEQAAHMYAQRMVSHNFFAHEDLDDPNLRTFEQRARHVGVANPHGNQNIAIAFGIQYQAGETVHVINKSKGLFSRTAWGQPIPNHTYQSFAESVIDQWLASPALSASILSKEVVQTGCGVAFYRDEGFPTFKVVQVYQYYEGVKP